MWNRGNKARLEKNQRKLEAGLVSDMYPDVTSIVVNMEYSQRGGNSLLRILNFYPDSYALFRVDCLSDDCVDGGFDLAMSINTMVRNRQKLLRGDLECDDSGPRPDHSTITYDIKIAFS